MNTDMMDLLRVMRRELWIRRWLVAGVYLATSLLLLVVGWNWPKVYTSSSTILVDQQSILEPLMEGTAVTTGVANRAEVAREIIFSSRAMDEVLNSSGWTTEDMTERQRERLATLIEQRTQVELAGENIIRISYGDQDPQRAYDTTQQLTNVFINHSQLAKQRESHDAYEFINGQVLQYQAKLKEAENALKKFRADNMDAQPGADVEVGARLADLKQRHEATRLAISELQTERATLEQQLTGQASSESGSSGVGQLRERLLDLEQQLATLRLSYHDTYPDVVSLKGQIASLRESIAQEQGRSTNGKFAVGGASGELFQTLRNRYSQTETELATLTQRLNETQKLLAAEQDRMVRISEVEAELAELTRDYQVNQEIYQSLLRQRESARISMNMDKENQGLTFQIQEPPAMPLTPQGVRFAHFMGAGLLLSVLLPFGIVYGLTLLDQKVRSRNVVSESIGLPVLASVYHVNKPTEYNFKRFRTSFLFGAILVSWVAYGYAAWLKLMGEL
ncbi:hypothetical protein F6455_00535 [Proteobacteria bacterium 005FR1]|nr:hypothetical protein [Proteobacteria bacterium 005FR1]